VIFKCKGCSQTIEMVGWEARERRYCTKSCWQAHRSALVIERFAQRVICDIATRHWYWTGNLDRKGYGRLARGGTSRKPGARTRAAHRVAYTLFKGPIPDGMFVLHNCDTPPCVNPEHLRVDTQDANLEEMRAKGRQTRGSAVWSSRLTEDHVRTMRDQWAAGATIRWLATEYGVGTATISKAVRGLTWQHVN
jgi:hypothetical protein